MVYLSNSNELSLKKEDASAIIITKPTNSNGEISSLCEEKEKKEVILNQGDGLLDAGKLTKCKNAVCFIYCNAEDSIRWTNIFLMYFMI